MQNIYDIKPFFYDTYEPQKCRESCTACSVLQCSSWSTDNVPSLELSNAQNEVQPSSIHVKQWFTGTFRRKHCENKQAAQLNFN